MSWGKYRKEQKFIRFNRKRSYKNWYGNESVLTISYKIKFVHSAKFQAISKL